MTTLKECYEDMLKTAESDNLLNHHSDKGTNHSYIEVYETLLTKYKDKEINLLEIGVNRGYSLYTWKKYFKNAKNLIGIEYQNSIVYKKDGVNIIYSDINDINNVNNKLGDIKFDIIIDDGSHKIEDQLFAFENLKTRIKDGGIYIIEDIQNLESDILKFKSYNPKIYDLRKNKNRWDDVLFVWEF
jgi:hypothetical protein